MKAPKIPKPADPRQDFLRAFRNLCHQHQPWRVFSDFCELAACSLANVVFPEPSREARYTAILKAYTDAQQRAFPELLALTVMGLEDCETDFLGAAFMELELGNHWKGQFFTPMSVARVMAEMTVTGLRDVVERNGFCTASEPACGAGVTVIAMAAAMRAAGFNPQHQLHVTAVDIDPTAAHMCFVQLALLGLPAKVVIGDTLRMTMSAVFRTPAHHLGLWDRKLARGYAVGSPADTAPAAPRVIRRNKQVEAVAAFYEALELRYPNEPDVLANVACVESMNPTSHRHRAHLQNREIGTFQSKN